MRVVLYAEGAGETVALRSMPPGPNEQLQPSEWGPGHHLLARALARIGQSAPVFHAPLRLGRGRVPRGSDLLDVQNLRVLCTWIRLEHLPNLVVILVDEDGNTQRRRDLAGAVEAFPSPPSPSAIVVAVARQEFESWLIADPRTVTELSGRPFDQPSAPESMKPGHAKETLQRHLLEAGKGAEIGQVRTGIARHLDLDRLRKTCASFDSFLSDLRAKFIAPDSSS